MQNIHQFRVCLQFAAQDFIKAIGDMCIFCGIMCCSFKWNLVEGLLFSTFTGHLFISRGQMTQIQTGHIIHAMTGCDRIQDIGSQHGVEIPACQMNAMIFQYMCIIFQMMPNFLYRLIFQNWFDLRQNYFTIQLLRCAFIIMCQGNIISILRIEGDRETDNLCNTIIQTGGFGIKGKTFFGT